MKKKRIIIFMHYLELGGAEMALIGLLNSINTDIVDVDLFLHQHTGAFMPLIPKNVNLLPEIPEYAAIERPISYSIRRGLIRSVVTKIKASLRLKRYLKKKPGYNSVASHIYMDTFINTLPSLEYLGVYDLAISFLDPPHIVQDKVLAKKKIEWIHTDFGSVTYDASLTHDRWAANDNIISISDSVSESFIKIFPDLRSKLLVIENIVSPALVRNRANEVAIIPKNDLCLCSIGRINAVAKNFCTIPIIASILRKMGLSFIWLIIGPGDATELEKLISEYNVGKEVILLGPKSNPYPYIKNCDIYVQPSLFEGKSIAVREAQILCKPTIITNYPTAASQISHKVDGIICEHDAQSVADAICSLARDANLRNSIIKYLQHNDFGMSSEITKIYNLL